MAARSGVIDTSDFKGIADLQAEVLSNDPVVAPAHEVVQDSDLIADYSMPPAHADAAPEHSSDTAATSTEDATAHPHADLAVADADHAYADVDHAYADVDHAYADHAYADATAPDSAVAFGDHSMLLADAGTPHSLGADAVKGQGDDSDKVIWWWAAGGAVAGGATGYLAGDDDDTTTSTTTSSAATPDVHVVVERNGAFIDTDGDGVHDKGETEAAVFGALGNASLAADHVTIHFNDVPLDALNLTGFGADDKIEFHVESMINHGIVANGTTNSAFLAQHLASLSVTSDPTDVWYGLATSAGGTGAFIGIHQHTWTALDFNHNPHSSVYMMSADTLNAFIVSTSSLFSTTNAAIAFWTDAGNALNDNALLLPNYTGGNTSAVRANLNVNNEGGLVDFIWPSAAPLGG